MALDLTKTVLGAFLLLGCGGTALAADTANGDGLRVKPILDARLRYENVDQPALDADALTFRLRAGAEARLGHFSFLAEAEGTAALIDDYNAFPFALPGEEQWRPDHSVIADPMNIELNRLQLQYKANKTALTLGRQRINLDDQRWVGSVGWRQNEQTFDAVRGEAKVGPVSLDATYAISQRTIFGYDAGRRTAYDGDFVLLGAGAKVGPVQFKAFSYLLDYDAKETAGAPAALAKQIADSQTYGIRAAANFKLGPKFGLGFLASYARQSAWQENTLDFASDYILGEGSLTYAGFTLTGGWEKLGSDEVLPGVRRAVQTPLATLHKFNGWADLFLVTPDNGLQDAYVGLAYKFPKVKALPGLNAAVSWHQFDSDFGDVEYGTEWNAQLGFKVGPVALLAKYAEFKTAAAAFVNTRKVWLQAEYSF